MILADIVGYTATVVGISLMLPQVVKSWRTKSVKDLSYGMVWLYVANCALWLVYGLLIIAYPIIAANFCALLVSLTQLALKIKYARKDSK